MLFFMAKKKAANESCFCLSSYSEVIEIKSFTSLTIFLMYSTRDSELYSGREMPHLVLM